MTILIVGGGPVGGITAIALANAGLRVHVVDKAPLQQQFESTQDIRGYALAASSKVLLDTLGVWSTIAPHAEPIMDIKITNGLSPWSLDFTYKEDDSSSPMGYIVEAFRVRRAIVQIASQHPNITWHEETSIAFMSTKERTQITLENRQEIFVDLVIGADGRASKVRNMASIETTSWSYQQCALVTTIQHENPHNGTAYEKFLNTGPFATLPMVNNCSAIVWANTPERTHSLYEMPEDIFLSELGAVLGPDYKKITLIQERQQYPLGVQIAKKYVVPRIALVGDAAHVIHPLAGQGLNLGIRDAAALTEIIVDAYNLGIDIGSLTVLERYQRWRRFDNTSLLIITDGLNRLFTNNNKALNNLRSFGLRLTSRLTPIKKLATSHAMGMIGKQPKLLKGQRL